ncbi:ScbA/BarX family gamma-butyrolactone biosynthesis protein [Streptomyces justiciae]|uniref:ScbA/BarX family gamma-butyrolactone biosynthesis protein n=1 Tax=Streptomyces justiciae TaxID=2780140 RepID=UPI00211778EA|nr:ScbA/BarX family gamma-butyrolactone biosynthesis protein [Streptomyces justiciae]MCW8375473.1 ScbA/BarX family gamma-butyrolactone biosynthesis protein [Streptomyces justiciae]
MTLPETQPTDLDTENTEDAAGAVPDAAAEAAARLRYDATVSRTLVHRTSVAEVFVTDSAAIGEETFLVAAQLPRGHLIGENAPMYDYTLLIEVVRQAGVLVAHEHLDVELGSAFIFRSLNLRTVGLTQLRIGATPAHVLVTMTVHPRRNKAGRIQGFTFSGNVALDGQVAMSGNGALLIVSQRAYRTLRAKRRTAATDLALPRFTPAAPSAVGRSEARNVVITAPVVASEARVSAQLVLDASHPHMFDHPLDHVPGHLQMEAARQLAIAAVAQLHGLSPRTLTISAIETEFTDYAELDQVTELRATVQGFRRQDDLRTLAVPVVIDIRQEGAVTTTIRLEVVQWT